MLWGNLLILEYGGRDDCTKALHARLIMHLTAATRTPAWPAEHQLGGQHECEQQTNSLTDFIALLARRRKGGVKGYSTVSYGPLESDMWRKLILSSRMAHLWMQN